MKVARVYVKDNCAKGYQVYSWLSSCKQFALDELKRVTKQCRQEGQIVIKTEIVSYGSASF